MANFYRKKFDKLWIGFLLGLMVPWIAVAVFYFVSDIVFTIPDYIRHIWSNHVFTPTLSLSVICNLLIFFIGIWTERYQYAKGVILATLLYAFLVFGLKLWL